MDNTYKTSSDFESLYDILYDNDNFLVVGYRKEEIKIFKIYFMSLQGLATINVEGEGEDHVISSRDEKNIWDLTKDEFVNSIKKLIDCYAIPNFT